MYLTNLKISNFKSYGELDVDFCPNVNCLVGNNGVGKTNLLEAIYYLSFCKGCRGGGDVPNIRRGEELLAVLTEILNDYSKVLERLDAIDEKLNRALPPSPGRFTRM